MTYDEYLSFISCPLILQGNHQNNKDNKNCRLNCGLSKELTNSSRAAPKVCATKNFAIAS